MPSELQDLAVLGQLIQFMNSAQQPQLQQQELAERLRGTNLNAALGILGLQQSEADSAARNAIMREQMREGGRQFDAGLMFQGTEGAANRELTRSEGEAGRAFAGREGAANRAMTEREGAAGRQAVATEGAANRALSREDMTERALQAWALMDQQRAIEEGRIHLGEKELAARTTDSAAQRALQKQGIGAELVRQFMMQNNTDPQTLGQLMTIMDERFGPAFGAQREREIEAKVRANTPALRVAGADAIPTLKAGFEPEVWARLEKELPAEKRDDFSLLPGSWNMPTTVEPFVPPAPQDDAFPTLGGREEKPWERLLKMAPPTATPSAARPARKPLSLPTGLEFLIPKY